MPEYEFSLITLMPEADKEGQFLYKIPPNVGQIKEIFLNTISEKPSNNRGKVIFTPKESDLLVKLMTYSTIDWKQIFEMITRENISNFNGKEIQKSLSFYKIVERVYEKKYSHIPFIEIYWAIHSIYTIFFQLLLEDYPEADIYHSASTGYAGLIASVASYKNKSRFVLTEHGIYTREREEEIIKATWLKSELKDLWINFFHQLSDCAYQRADKVFSLFETNKDIQVDIGCPLEKIEVIPNGVKLENFKEVAQVVEKRNPVDTINVGAIVRVVPIKDIITMLDAFSIVNKSVENVKFYVMGPTDEDPEYYNFCLDYLGYLKLDNVIFTGTVNIKDYLKDMDLMVLTSISEGQPLVILEGLACKLPFVSTKVGDYRSLVLGDFDDYGPAGEVASVMNSHAIANSIVKLCKNKELRKKYGQAGYDRVSNLYRFEDIIEKYKDIYKLYGAGD